MQLFEYVFYLGVITIIFTSLWKLLVTILSSILKDIGIHKDYSFLVFKTIGYYILVSLAALHTIKQIQEVQTFGTVLFAVLGTFVIYATIASNLTRNRMRAVLNYERKRVQVMRYDGFLLMACIILFILTLIYPIIAEFRFHYWILEQIDKIYEAPILKWIIGFFAFFYMINILFRGVKATNTVIDMLLNRKPKNRKTDGNDYDQNFYTDYEEVAEDTSEQQTIK